MGTDTGKVDRTFHLTSDGFFRCQAFQQFLWQSHSFGTRHASPQVDVTLRQIHSDIVWDAHGMKDREQEGDALITNDCEVSIGVRTADCVPIVLLDSKNRVVGAVHAGWRGTAAEVSRCTIEKASATFGTQPVDIWAAIGPCVRECCYEVGPEVAAHFVDIFPEWKTIPPKPDGKRNLDLAGANVRQMQASGIPASQIFDSCLCTSCQIETFHSYRREPTDPGRLVSAITRIS